MANYVFKDYASKSDVPENHGTDPGTSYEVFRNNTTAVEVIVKDVYNKKKKTHTDFNESRNKLQNEVDFLKNELEHAKKSLSLTRKSFQAIIRGMRKQIETANSRESDTMTNNLTLKLENEKLKILLESKTKLTSRLKKELLSLKRVLKFVMKNVCNVPEITTETVSIGSDPEYEDFETDLKKNIRVKFLEKTYNDDTFDSTLSKEFDKKP